MSTQKTPRFVSFKVVICILEQEQKTIIPVYLTDWKPIPCSPNTYALICLIFMHITGCAVQFWEITLRRNFLIEYKYPTILDSCLFCAVKNMITVGCLRYASLSAPLTHLRMKRTGWIINDLLTFCLYFDSPYELVVKILSDTAHQNV